MNRRKLRSVFVWDVDETLGSFSTLDKIVILLEKIYNRKLIKEEIYLLIDIFPEILRPNIIKMLRYLKNQKKKHNCQKVVIYTNNIGPNNWVNTIKGYLEYKIKGNLFDRIIRAYKINNIQIEPKRTEHGKTYEDLIRCLNVDEIENVCFIDDQMHPMIDDVRVNSLQIPPYYKDYRTFDIITRLLNSPFKNSFKDIHYFINFVNDNYDTEKYFNGNEVMYNELDDQVLADHLKRFIKKTRPRKTRIQRTVSTNKTRRL